MTAAVAVARAGGAETIGVNAEDGSRTDDGYLLEFALAAREAGATRVRYCDTIGGDSPGRIRERFAKLAAAVGLPIETHCHNDLGMAVANSTSGALGDLDAGWTRRSTPASTASASGPGTPTCCRASWRSGTRAGSPRRCRSAIQLDLSWARGSGCGRLRVRPAAPDRPARSRRNAFAHESGIHADGALKDRRNYELYDDSTLGPFPSDWYAREGRVVLTGEYGGKAGFRHVLDGLGVLWPTR